MDQNGKFPDYSGIWDNAYRARDIHMALLFALAAAAFTEGWEALRPRHAASKQGLSSNEESEATARQKADAC